MTKQSGPYVDPPEWAVRPHKRVCDDIGQVDRALHRRDSGRRLNALRVPQSVNADTSEASDASDTSDGPKGGCGEPNQPRQTALISA